MTPDAQSLLAADQDAQAVLVRSLMEAASWPHPVRRVRALETHISHVLLAGQFAYKIKKPLSLGFLDFGTLEKRRHYCEEELRLNRRLAPDLYLEVVPITGTPEAPRPGGDGEAIEYAVKMRQFPQSALLDRLLARRKLSPEQIDALADQVAAFHGGADTIRPGDHYGSPETVWSFMAQNFTQLRNSLPADSCGPRLDSLEAWSRGQWNRHQEFFRTRQREKRVRECHGDLHLGNVALIRGKPLIFDCIEFNPSLCWIDVINDAAFMTMDLEERGRPDFGHRFLNRYLEISGDYGGLPLLPFYQVYRALVRAKVASIRASQEDPRARRREMATCEKYLDYAERVARPREPRLILLHGLSGSGKSWVAQILLEDTGAIRLRSDVERKRLHGLAPLARSGSSMTAGIYGEEQTLATYRRLADLAGQVLAAGYPVIVDAASLKAWQRELFRQLARERRIPFLLLDCRACENTLRQRLRSRSADASEADVAVLEHQILSQDPLGPEEQEESLHIDTDSASREEIMHLRII